MKKENQNQELAQTNGLSELANFVCILRGDVKYLEKIKEYIEKVYINKGLVTLVKSDVSSEDIHLLTDTEWEEHQELKKRDDRMIGAGFP